MAKNSAIAWTDVTWNPIRGCSRMVDTIDGKKEADPLCTNCYAARDAYRFSKAPGSPFEGLVMKTNTEPIWTGKVLFVEKHLADPLKWRDPRRIFVNSMSDLFHERMGFDLIDEIVYVMARADWHIYQVLTKRVARALEWMKSSPERYALASRLKHVHWGASVGTQRHADLRVPIMLEWPVQMRWLSMEPLLEPVSLRKWLRHEFSANPRTGFCEDCKLPKSDLGHFTAADAWGKVAPEGTDACIQPPPLHWIVVGGESGPRDRIRHTPHHAYRFMRDQARFADIPFFQKQFSALDGAWFKDLDQFAEDLQIQEWPAAT